MNRRDLIKSAVALSLYGPSLPALARPRSKRAAGSLAAPSNSVPFPRTAMLAMSGSGATIPYDQTYPPLPYSGQVSTIGSNGYFATSSYDSDTPNPCAWMGRFDIVIVGGNWEGWDDSGTYDRALLVDAIKQATNVSGYFPATVWQYNSFESVNETVSAHGYPTWYSQVANESWYLYSTKGNTGTPVSAGGSFLEVNWAVDPSGECFTPARSTATFDGSPEDPPQYAAAYFTELTALRHTAVSTVVSGTIPASAYTDSRFYPNVYSGSCNDAMKAPNMDAMFIDNCWGMPFYAGFYDLASNYPKLMPNSPACEWMLAGDAHFFKRYQDILARAYPGRTYLTVCNMADWAQVWASAPGGADFTAATQKLGQIHGGVLEKMIAPGNPGDTVQGQFNAAAVFGSYQGIMNFCVAPKQVVFNGYVASATDFQGARYILAAALMDDGYCCNSNNAMADGAYVVDHYVWYDEYGGNPNTGIPKGWLGFRVGSPPTGPAVNNLWIAEFDNGVAICNPYANGPQTITAAQINAYLGSAYTFSYIHGIQDATTNPGGPFSQATLADSDGLLLLKSASTAVTLQGSWDSGYVSSGVMAKSVVRNSNVNAGDILVVCVLGNVDNNVQGVSDGQFGALTFDPGSQGFDTPDSSWMQLFWGTATQNYSADPSNQVVATFKSTTDFAEVIVAHFRPPAGYVFAPTASVKGASVFDDTQIAPGTGAGAIKSGATTFSTPPMLAFAGCLDVTGSGGQTVANGWSSGFTGNAGNFVPAWTLVTAAGGEEGSWTAAASGGSDTYQGVLVGLKLIAG